MSDHSDMASKYFRDLETLNRVLAEGVADALKRHQKLGQKVVTWRDGKIKWVEPEELFAESKLRPNQKV